MGKKQIEKKGGIVFSTDPSFRFDDELENETETPDKKDQQLVIKIDRKQRAGKAVTLVEGFVGRKDDLEVLGKELKTLCGTGGSVKEGLILIQGDQREKIRSGLHNRGYIKTRIIK